MQINEISTKVNEVASPQAQLLRPEVNRSPTQEKQEPSLLPSDEGQISSWDKEEIKGIVKGIADALQDVLNKLNERIVFSIHEETGQVVVKVVDSETNKVIRQIPPEELLKLREKLDELIGILFEARA